MLKLDLTGWVGAVLSFQWRTFLADTSDRFVVSYFVGDGLGEPGNDYDWFADPALGNNELVPDATCGFAHPCANPWLRDSWTELLRARDNSSFHSEFFPLPGRDVIYVAFWMDDGEGDYAKLDNVIVMPGLPVPEPSTGLLVGAGLLALGARRPRRAGRPRCGDVPRRRSTGAAGAS